jgi:hypothetical protein
MYFKISKLITGGKYVCAVVVEQTGNISDFEKTSNEISYM